MSIELLKEISLLKAFFFNYWPIIIPLMIFIAGTFLKAYYQTKDIKSTFSTVLIVIGTITLVFGALLYRSLQKLYLFEITHP